MSKTIVRKTALLFDANHVSSPSNDIAQFGSEAAGSPVFNSDPAIIQALSAFKNGWTGAVTAIAGGNTQPNLEDRNALDYLFSYFLNYLFQEGIPEYDSGTTYWKGGYAKSTDGNGTLYRSIQDNNTGNALTNLAWWVPANGATGGTYVVFDGTASIGTNCVILGSNNVSSVQHTATGEYLVNFTSPMSVDGSGNGIYGFSGSAGTQNGASGVAGDNNEICGGVPGHPGYRTANQCIIYCWEAGTMGPPTYASFGLEDSSCISVQFFG